MVQKRQLAEEEYEVSPKHLKLDQGCELVPSLQLNSEDGSLHSDKDEGCFSKPIIGVDSGFASGKFTDLPLCTMKDVDYTLSGSLSNSSWVSSTTSEEDLRSEAPCRCPDYSPLKPRSLLQPEDAYSCLLACPPLKEIPIGPEYQADIPEFLEYEAKFSCGEDQIKFMGSSITPMPKVDSPVYDDETVGRGRTNCSCRNPGSLGCVQQHINKATEIISRNIGHERFEKLGFGNMGEVVSDKWTEDDEQLFHETVYSNPASFGKNFWHHLAKVFPSCTNQDIVSYYFNVFVLRRRAEQNRCDPVSADSDDDEWQGCKRSEEDDYSCDNDPHRYNLQEHGNSNSSRTTMVDENEGDDSSMSSDTPPCMSEADVSESWANHQLIFEPSDSKAWDVGYFSCSRTKTDFLPTGSMIEEVFGVGSWDFEATDDDDKGLN